RLGQSRSTFFATPWPDATAPDCPGHDASGRTSLSRPGRTHLRRFPTFASGHQHGLYSRLRAGEADIPPVRVLAVVTVLGVPSGARAQRTATRPIFDRFKELIVRRRAVPDLPAGEATAAVRDLNAWLAWLLARLDADEG